MMKSEIVARSPFRILEKSINGALPAGHIGVIASPKGVGKTACLVHLATDKLFQGRHIIHVSFAGKTDHIVSWYEDIFKEITEHKHLANSAEIHDEIIKRRVIMNFSQQGITAEQLIRSLRALIQDGNFTADLVIIDGYSFAKGSPDSLAQISAFGKEVGVAFWFSASTDPDNPDTDENRVPVILGSYLPHLSVVITLRPEMDHIELQLVKDYNRYPQEEDLHLKLDTRTLLIMEN
jgi:hypothetical protein